MHWQCLVYTIKIDDASKKDGLGTPAICRAKKISVVEICYYRVQYLVDKKWGLQSTTFPEQGTDNKNFVNVLLFSNNATYSSHLNFLENYNPNREVALDPSWWIPKGLLNDMMDAAGGEPQQSTISDNVSGFTNSQFFNAIQSDVNSKFDFKAKFFLQNNSLQQTEINQLFSSYGY